MARINDLRLELEGAPRTWLVTGAAGFIGSHLTETLLSWGQHVRALDNFSTGSRGNLDDVRARVGAAGEARLEFLEADIVDAEACASACVGVDHVLHQAALGSVPRSVADPLASHRANVDGFINMLVGARDAKVQSCVYASSSSVFGDHPDLPKREDAIGAPLSPYAATKRINEIYAEAFSRSYDLRLNGLRYFNVFGPRQDPNGAYAAVIPRWLAELMGGSVPLINGDGETSRDFCPIANVVQANLLAATTREYGRPSRVYNVGLGRRTTLNELFAELSRGVATRGIDGVAAEPRYGPERVGDVRHSQADVSRARTELGFEPQVDLAEGLDLTASWYVERLRAEAAR